MREQLSAAGATRGVLELVHFGCTSEDINNLSYARMLQAARAQAASKPSTARSTSSAHWRIAMPTRAMLARTHGQPASPTTLGKEFANVTRACAARSSAGRPWRSSAKWNGAVGNFNAHVAAVPDADWPTISRRFVESLGLEFNPYTTQIEPHDWIAEYCDALAAAMSSSSICRRDCWGYISLGYLRQRAVAARSAPRPCRTR